MGIQTMISVLKNNASQLNKRDKFKGIDGPSEVIYKGKIKEKEFTPYQIKAAKEAFQSQVKAEKRKTVITLLITMAVLPIIIYAIIQLYMAAFV